MLWSINRKKYFQRLELQEIINEPEWYQVGDFMNRPERKRTTSSRRDSYTVIALLTLIGALIFRIPLEHLIGDNGIAYFGTANEIYLVVAGTISYGLSEAVAILVRYRVRREQFKSAERVLSGALVFGGGIGLILSILFGFLGHSLSEKIFHIPLAGMAVSMMAPAIFFFILTGIFRGYFQGNGSKVPSMHSQVLHMVFLFVAGMIGAAALHGYGVKVSAFLQNEDYASAYGAKGAAIGLLVASIFCFLHVLILFFVFSKKINRQVGRELQKNMDTKFHVIHMLAGTGALYSLNWFCFHVLPLLDQSLFFHFGVDADNLIGQWGQYYGKCLVVIGVICGTISIICLIPIRRIIGNLEREENRIAKEKLGILIHQCAAITIPAAAFLAVLAENILDVLFKVNQKQTVGWMQLGSLIIIFYVFASVFMEMLTKSRKIKYVTGIGAIALVLHGGIVALLLKTAKIGIWAIVIGVILFYAVLTIVGFLLVSRSFQYIQAWMKSFAVTIIAAAVSAVIAMLLNKVIVSLLGSLISMIICLLIAIIVYMVLLIVMRAFRSEELEEMAGGRLLIMLAGLLHFS